MKIPSRARKKPMMLLADIDQRYDREERSQKGVKKFKHMAMLAASGAT
jgi:hypothetical protein